MVVQMIHCDWCGQTGWHKVAFIYTYKGETCKECHRMTSSNWKFWFCDQECFFSWIKDQEIAEKGITCQDCHGTGWAFGFEENGTCKTCDGAKRMKRVLCEEPPSPKG